MLYFLNSRSACKDLTPVLYNSFELKGEELTNFLIEKSGKTWDEFVEEKVGFIESWGRGTIKIMEKCQEQGLPEPDFEEENGVFIVRFYQDKWNEENLKRLGLKERQIKAVIYVKEKGKITNKEYRSMFDISDRTALSDLNDLREKGFLGKIGITGRSTIYKLSRSKPEINPKFEKLKAASSTVLISY